MVIVDRRDIPIPNKICSELQIKFNDSVKNQIHHVDTAYLNKITK